MRWFRRNSSDRTLDDDNGPQLLRLTSLTRRRSPSNTAAADNRTPPAATRLAETPEHSAREFLRPSTTTSNGFSRSRLPVNRNDGKYASMTNCYNIEMARITQTDRNDDTKRSYLSKRRPISPSRIKLKYLAKQQQQQHQQQQNQQELQLDNIPYRRQSPHPLSDGNYSQTNSRLCSAKSMEWDVGCAADDGPENNNLNSPELNNNRHSHQTQQQKNHRQSSIMGSISKAKSIDYLSSPFNSNNSLPEIQFNEIGIRVAALGDEINGAVSSLMISNQKKLSGSTFTVFGGDTINNSSSVSTNYYDDGDSGILVNDSGQCSILSDAQQHHGDEIKTVYLRRSAETAGKSFGLLISQFARTFETDHNRFRIRHVLRNSEADLSGEICVGDEIISVNDVPAIELNFDQIQEIINAKTVLRLVLQRGKSSPQLSSRRDISSAERNGSTLTLVTATPPKESCMRRFLTQQTLNDDVAAKSHSSEFSLSHPLNNNVSVHGTSIIKINCDNVNLNNSGTLVPAKGTVTTSQTSSGTSQERLSQNFCTIPRKRNGLSSLQQSHPYTFHTVLFEKGAGRKTLGFTIVGGNDSPKGALGIFVKRILENGQAADCDNLFEGDEILAVNGMVCHDLAHQEAVKMFKSIRTGKIVLNISRRMARIQV